MEASPDELWKKYLTDGQSESFRVFYRKVYPLLYFTAYKYLRNADQAYCVCNKLYDKLFQKNLLRKAGESIEMALLKMVIDCCDRGRDTLC